VDERKDYMVYLKYCSGISLDGLVYRTPLIKVQLLSMTSTSLFMLSGLVVMIGSSGGLL
jgi:hypothetical protein